MHLTLLLLDFEINCRDDSACYCLMHLTLLLLDSACEGKSSHKLVNQAISNGWIRTSNEYMEMFKGQQLDSFHDGSDTYLTEE
jgi:hypothetical protein